MHLRLLLGNLHLLVEKCHQLGRKALKVVEVEHIDSEQHAFLVLPVNRVDGQSEGIAQVLQIASVAQPHFVDELHFLVQLLSRQLKFFLQSLYLLVNTLLSRISRDERCRLGRLLGIHSRVDLLEGAWCRGGARH